MSDFEKLGAFYLGKRVDKQDGALLDELVLYDAKDLTTHAFCVGMTGSGKTGLCLSLLEEAAIDNIPALCIDPKDIEIDSAPGKGTTVSLVAAFFNVIGISEHARIIVRHD